LPRTFAVCSTGDGAVLSCLAILRHLFGFGWRAAADSVSSRVVVSGWVYCLAFLFRSFRAGCSPLAFSGCVNLVLALMRPVYSYFWGLLGADSFGPPFILGLIQKCALYSKFQQSTAFASGNHLAKSSNIKSISGYNNLLPRRYLPLRLRDAVRSILGTIAFRRLSFPLGGLLVHCLGADQVAAGRKPAGDRLGTRCLLRIVSPP